MFQVQTHVGPATVIGGWQRLLECEQGHESGRARLEWRLDWRAAVPCSLFHEQGLGQDSALLSFHDEARAEPTQTGRPAGQSSSRACCGGPGPNAGRAGDRSSSRADDGGVGPNVARAGGARAAPTAAVRGRTPGGRVTGAQAGQTAAVLGRRRAGGRSSSRAGSGGVGLNAG
jgi:hypothetical protein